MATKVDYTKVNATHESKTVLNVIAAEQGKPVYKVLDSILREHFGEYFDRIKC